MKSRIRWRKLRLTIVYPVVKLPFDVYVYLAAGIGAALIGLWIGANA